MSTMTTKTRSYSQLSQWSDCGMRYYLERVLKRPSNGAVWLPAGTAVHRTIEEYLRGSLARESEGTPPASPALVLPVQLRGGDEGSTGTPAEQQEVDHLPGVPGGPVKPFDTAGSFARNFSESLAADEAKAAIPLRDWPYAGRRSPQSQVDWWRAEGPGLCQKYIDWYEANDDVQVWITPDGEPAIELDMTVNFGKVPVRLIIDQVLLAGTALIVVDVKSGQLPDNTVQLGIYASALELKWPGLRPAFGTYFAPKLTPPLHQPIPLDSWQYSAEYLTEQFGMFDRAERTGIYVARPGKHCNRCGVAGSCPAMGVKP